MPRGQSRFLRRIALAQIFYRKYHGLRICAVSKLLLSHSILRNHLVEFMLDVENSNGLLNTILPRATQACRWYV